MAKNKNLIPGKLYQLNDCYFVFESMFIDSFDSATGTEHKLNKDDIIMVVEVIKGKEGDYPLYRVLTPFVGIQYATRMLYHRVKEVTEE